ncbi:MAG: alpha/beta hydrolase [Sphingobacteriales bacterium]|nr:MAG: alpha/beta hydrolase [Sphingobacteriales bacterium]
MSNAQSGYIKVKNAQLHYLQMGSGKQVLLAFHGYANDAGLFLPFAKKLGDKYTIISVDMPHHGKSQWQSGELSLPMMQELLQHLQNTYDVKKISLLGYSMGGRLCLKLVECCHADIDKVVLMASDGLRFNFFYYFLTRTVIGKGLFRSFVEKPAKYFPLIERLKRWKWIDESRYKFAMQYLQTDEKRTFLYNVWPAMSALIPLTSKVKANIRQQQIPVHIFMGAYDRMIPLKLAESFCKDLPQAELHILQKGHRLMNEECVAEISNCLLS